MFAQESMDLQAALRQLEARQVEPPPAAKQRRFARFPVRGEARLWPGEAGKTPGMVPTVHVRDVSRGGVGVLTDQPTVPGQFWQVQLGTGKTAVATRPGFARYCLEVMPGAYLVGIAFGIEAGILLSLGVPANDLAERDEVEDTHDVRGDFVDPATFLGEDAA